MIITKIINSNLKKKTKKTKRGRDFIVFLVTKYYLLK